jgi:integrase
MRLSFGPLKITLAKTYQHGNSLYYQRHVPTPLRDRYPVKILKHNLKTLDPLKAASLAAALERHYNAEFSALKDSPDATPAALKAHATAFLRQWGLEPQSPSNNPMAVELLQDYIDGKRAHFAGGDESVYRNAGNEEFLTPLEAHLRIHPKRDNERFVTYQRRAFASLIAVTGDKAIDEFLRADARAYLEATLLRVKTTTVRRLIGAVSAVFATYIRENDLTRPNPFAHLKIVKEGHDAVTREPFTTTQVRALLDACKAQDDPMRWILAMLAGTGARLAEIVGLPLDDIYTEHEVPHVHLQVHPWRDIKGANGIRGKKDRTVPLHGMALWAAKRVKETAEEGQRMAFPQYTDETGCRATSASAALNAWMRRLPLEHTCHELRHTMKDLLRAVQCPKDISDSITGHGKKDTGDGYGHGHPLEVKSEWLQKVAP